MKILFLSSWFPFPPNNGSKVRILTLLKILASNHEITLLSFNDEPEKSPQIASLSNICKKIITLPRKEFDPNSIKAILGFLSINPRWLIDTFSSEMATSIQDTLAEQEYDIIIASQIEMASYNKYFNDLAAIFDEIEIGVPLERYTKAKSLFHRLRQGITWFKHKHYLTKLLKFFPVCTVASLEECNLLVDNTIREDNLFVIPNCIDWTEYQCYKNKSKTNTIIFTGAFRYQPNYEAMTWFLKEIYPAILDSVPDVQLIITGDHMNLPLPTVKNMTATGFVDDIRPLIAQARVSIVPLRSGGGTRLKILEAMALHTPVVSTTKGAQGIEVTHQKDILIADTPKAFCQEVIRILTDNHLGKQIAKHGFTLVKEKYSPAAISNKYENLLVKATQFKLDNSF